MADEAGYFGERVAARYDDHSWSMFDPAVVGPAVDLLVEIAGGGPALEFAIGTGRIALPLAERGVPVAGIDTSEAMLARLREKPGSERIEAAAGDMATTRLDGEFALVFLVFNTIFNLTTQDEQVACFQNVAAHLEPGGCFVIEVIVPQLQRLPPGQVMHPFHVGESYWGLDEYDVVTQRVTSHHLTFAGDKVRRRSLPFRYVWPSELDLMARLAGMTLRERWTNWERAPFTSRSGSHVSVWEKDA